MKVIWGLGVLLLLVLIAPFASAVSYDFSVSETGETTVYVTIEGSAVIPLPKDVVNPEIKGGILTLVSEGVQVVADTEATLAYASSYHTKKQGGIWYFDAAFVSADTVDLALPAKVKVVQVDPPSSISSDGNLTLSWEDLLAENISLSYVLPASNSELLNDDPEPEPGLLPYLVLGLVMAGVGVIVFKQKKKEPPEPAEVNLPDDLPDVTDGQMNIIRAANDNEALILKTMLKHNGHMKRNALEKQTKLSKSSLASSLKNLEHKKILEIDRSFHVHYLKFSEWFKKLE